VSPENHFEDVAAHTKAKHDILRQYLKAWFPIMVDFAKKSGKHVLRYVDGFAGQGIYDSGDYVGSPIIALNVVNDSDYLKKQAMIFEFLFFEQTPDRCKRLQQGLASLQKAASIRTEVQCGEFESKLSQWLDETEPSKINVPTFIFVDPFGPAGFSMKLMHRILKYRSSEVLVTLNLQSAIRWFLENTAKHQTLDALFGCRDWERCRLFSDPSQRQDYLRSLYKMQLISADKSILTRDFRMENQKGLTSYYLVYATHDSKGLEVMKESMWNVDRSGSFEYSDITNPAQIYLFNNDEIAGQEYGLELLSRYSGRIVSKDELVKHNMTHPHYLKKHLNLALNWLTIEAKSKVTFQGARRGTGWSADTKFLFPEVK
jgi:three-Cys-motif partner protein